jgi:hypothetical protein
LNFVNYDSFKIGSFILLFGIHSVFIYKKYQGVIRYAVSILIKMWFKIP